MSLAGVTKGANHDLGGQDEFGGEHREFDVKTEGADEGKSSLFPFDAC